MNKRVEGHKIKLARTAKGITQQTLSDLSGLSRPTISKIEKEGTDNTEYIEIIAKAIKIDPNELEKRANWEGFSPAKLMSVLEQAIQSGLTEHDKQLTLEMLDWFRARIISKEGQDVAGNDKD